MQVCEIVAGVGEREWKTESLCVCCYLLCAVVEKYNHLWIKIVLKH